MKTGEILIDLVTTDGRDCGGEREITDYLEKWVDDLCRLSLDGKIAGILHTTNNSVADVVKDEGTETLYGQGYFYEEPVSYTHLSHVNKVIAVVSGKGGVGKSMVTASLARMVKEQGFSVGILDADITGPSIPKMYGVHEAAVGDENGIFPQEAKDGTKIMSVNLLLPNESDPVIWRGPVIANVVTQFWTDVMWGELDYLFVDMPPGRCV